MSDALRFAMGLVLAGVLVSPAPSRAGAPVRCTLRALGAARGVTIGAGFVEGSHEQRFRDTLAREYGGVTVPVYWSQLQPMPDAFDFTAADAAVAAGESAGLRMRGHPLVWGRLALPNWVQAAGSPEELRGWLDARIRTVLARYRGRIAAYDVVNEPLTIFGGPGPRGDALDVNVFSELLGAGYVREALEIAHDADPDAKLFVNDFFVLGPGEKQDRFYALVKGLVDTGAPLHGVGLQGHLRLPLQPDFAPSRAEMTAAIARFAALGLEVEVTELDAVLAERSGCELAWQRDAYHDVVAACLASPACVGVTTWGITDAFTWIAGFFGVDGAPLPFDETYARKAAWFGMRDALAAAACPGGACPDGCVLDSCGASPGCAPAPNGCCVAPADCVADACADGPACVNHACVPGTPRVCDDGDPCTIDSCDPASGCVTEDLRGVEGAACACARERPAACAEATVPRKAERGLARACAHLAAAADAAGRKLRRRLAKATKRLRQTARVVRRAGRRGRLPGACSSALGAFLEDAIDRARDARRDPVP